MVPDFIQALIHWDQTLFHEINEKWTNPLFNQVLPLFREKLIWIPLYILLVYIWIKKYQLKGFYLVLALAISVILSDLLSAHWIKLVFRRLRPCQDLANIHHLILRIDCGSGFSFVSSHAANHFTIAAFTAIWLRKNYKFLEPLPYLWAGIISYAQVYVGVHYPIDVLAGALLGLILGWVLGTLSMKWIGIDRLTSKAV